MAPPAVAVEPERETRKLRPTPMTPRCLRFVLAFAALAAIARADSWDGAAFFRRIQPVPKDSGFRMPGYWVWDGSVVKVGDTYNLFASAWPKGHPFPEDYRQHSEIVRATSKNPLGPYVFQEVVLRGRGGSHWDATIAHNPYIKKIGDTYVLWYLSSDGHSLQANGRTPLRRIGYATARSITGPWHRSDQPIFQTDMNNPAVWVEPDGSLKMILRDADLHVFIATAPGYRGPYTIRNPDVWPAARLEDFDIWKGGDKYYFICEDNVGKVTGHDRWGAVFVSDDGISGWKPDGTAPAYDHDIRYTDGTVLHCVRRERPQLIIEDGKIEYLITSVYDGKDTWAQPVALDPPLPLNPDSAPPTP